MTLLVSSACRGAALTLDAGGVLAMMQALSRMGMA